VPLPPNGVGFGPSVNSRFLTTLFGSGDAKIQETINSPPGFPSQLMTHMEFGACCPLVFTPDYHGSIGQLGELVAVTWEFSFLVSSGQFTTNGIFAQETIVPIPAALPLFATGLGVLGLLGWRRKRKSLQLTQRT
jgi:hypothetical protein